MMIIDVNSIDLRIKTEKHVFIPENKIKNMKKNKQKYFLRTM